MQYPASNQRVKGNNYVRHSRIKTIEIAPNLVAFLQNFYCFIECAIKYLKTNYIISKSLGGASAPPLQLALGTHVGKNCSLPGQPFSDFVYDQQHGVPNTYMHVTSLRNKTPLTLRPSIIFQSLSSNPRTSLILTTCAEVVTPKKQNHDTVLQCSKMNVTTVQV